MPKFHVISAVNVLMEENRTSRARDNIKTQTTQTIQQLKAKEQALQQKTHQIENELKQLEKRRKQIKQALQTEEIQFNRKLVTELTSLKDRKIELFTITAEEQIIKLTAQLGVSFVRWLLE